MEPIYTRDILFSRLYHQMQKVASAKPYRVYMDARTNRMQSLIKYVWIQKLTESQAI